jgi:hypothetical protein
MVDGHRIAIECSNFGPEQLFALHGIPLQPQEFRSVFLPVEPHAWTSVTLARKTKHVAVYQAHTGADQAWLLLHSSIGLLSSVSENLTGSAIDLFKLGAHQTAHTFTRVYVQIDPIEQPQLLYRDDDSASITRWTRSNVLGFPVQQIWFGLAVALGPHDTPPPSPPPRPAIRLQPLDRAFSIDYSGFSDRSQPSGELPALHHIQGPHLRRFRGEA